MRGYRGVARDWRYAYAHAGAFYGVLGVGSAAGDVVVLPEALGSFGIVGGVESGVDIDWDIVVEFLAEEVAAVAWGCEGVPQRLKPDRGVVGVGAEAPTYKARYKQTQDPGMRWEPVTANSFGIKNVADLKIGNYMRRREPERAA